VALRIHTLTLKVFAGKKEDLKTKTREKKPACVFSCILFLLKAGVNFACSICWLGF